MIHRLLSFCSIGVLALLLSSCETTTDYGYFVDRFDDDAIVLMYRLMDEAVARGDYEEYISFFAPGFTQVDKSDANQPAYYGHEFFDQVEEIFNTTSMLEIRTVVMDIEYTVPGSEALVTVQEEEKRIQYGNTQHFTSLYEMQLGFEDGWIFINRSERTAFQVIDE
ncbi:hypothetical protein [Pelagicoccus sp. SDUM812003]|uniref:hypothetical protein n=1 Tax=Pelagicoccus sp. SDUM812003 TaxID=3041267 RepID=UPI00280FDA3C|nr:hypothetical protein [Pelagicoccus sp. SDUM812003]MDQ8201872.1 hypothetical protein [Pelagicoccus sp. SDUM812003]